MEHLVQFREIMIGAFKRYEATIIFLSKFLIGLLIFGIINTIDCHMPQLALFFAPPFELPFVIILSVLFAIVPVSFAYSLLVLNIALQISGALPIAIFIILFLVCILLLYVRLAPSESVLILAVIICFYLKIPYAVPLVAGIYCGITAILPISIGVFMWTFIPSALSLVKQVYGQKIEIFEFPNMMKSGYLSVFNSLSGNENWIFTAFIMALAFVVVFSISKMAINYSKELSIGIGAVTIILCFITTMLVANVKISIVSIIFSVLFSALIAIIIKFFDNVLDYQRAESVEFEDEKNYYFIKVVPKVILSRKQRILKHVHETDDDEFELDDY